MTYFALLTLFSSLYHPIDFPVPDSPYYDDHQMSYFDDAYQELQQAEEEEITGDDYESVYGFVLGKEHKEKLLGDLLEHIDSDIFEYLYIAYDLYKNKNIYRIWECYEHVDTLMRLREMTIDYMD
jgi:hypothetical protein